MKLFDGDPPAVIDAADFMSDAELDEKRSGHDRPDRPDRHGFRVACVRNDIYECCFTLQQARALVASHERDTGHHAGILGSCTIPGP